MVQKFCNKDCEPPLLVGDCEANLSSMVFVFTPESRCGNVIGEKWFACFTCF